MIGLRVIRMGLVGKLGEEEWIRLFEKYNCHPANNFINLFSSLPTMLCQSFQLLSLSSTLLLDNNNILQRNDRLLTFQALDKQELLLPTHPHQQVLPLLLHPADTHQSSSSHRPPSQPPDHSGHPGNHSLPAPRLRPVSLHSPR